MATHLQGLIPFVVYNTNDSTATHYTEVHNGNEAAAYLQFIVDYYDCLPQYMAFIHAHRRDVKVAPDHDMVSMLSVCSAYECLSCTIDMPHVVCLGATSTSVLWTRCTLGDTSLLAVTVAACRLCTVVYT